TGKAQRKGILKKLVISAPGMLLRYLPARGNPAFSCALFLRTSRWLLRLISAAGVVRCRASGHLHLHAGLLTKEGQLGLAQVGNCWKPALRLCPRPCACTRN